MFCLKFKEFQTLYIYVRTVRASRTMCVKCGGFITVDPKKAMESAGKMQLAQGLAGGITSFALGLFEYGFGEDYSTSAGGGSKRTVITGSEKSEKETPEDNFEQYRENVESILGKDEFNKLSADMQKDILSKYSAYKNVLKLDDTEATPRLKNYVKALQAHQKELEMGAFNENLFNEALAEVAKDPNNPTDAELEEAKALTLKKKQECEIKIEDSNIETQRQSGTDEEYYGALNDRGQGYVDMYDKNNDGVISFDEFKALEEKDLGSALSTDEVEATRAFFNRIDKDNDGIEAHEMASHLYAVSRMNDKSEQGAPNTVADITIGEWLDSQQILTNKNVSTRYDNIYNQLYGVLKPKE